MLFGEKPPNVAYTVLLSAGSIVTRVTLRFASAGEQSSTFFQSGVAASPFVITKTSPSLWQTQMTSDFRWATAMALMLLYCVSPAAPLNARQSGPPSSPCQRDHPCASPP